MKYDNYHIFFDEKGPTKTIKPNKQDDYQFNWEGNSTDNVPVYLGVYVGFPKIQVTYINDEYNLFEENMRKSIKSLQQLHEIKGKNIFKKGYRAFPKLKPDSLQFANGFLDFMLSKPDIYIHVALPHKAQPVVQSRLQNWLYWLENKHAGIVIDNIFYSLVKYLVIDDLNHNFRNILFNEDAKTKNILDVLKKELQAFSERNKNIDNRAGQVKLFNEIVYIIKKYPIPYSMHQNDTFKYTFDQLTYGLELDLLTLNGTENGTGKHHLFPDDDAPVDAFKEIEFLSVEDSVKSEDTPGVRMADILAGLIAKILVPLNMDLSRDKADLNNIKKLPKEWFEMTDLSLTVIKKLQRLIFSRQYQIIHGVYGDHYVALHSYVDFISQFENVEEIKQQKDIVNEFHNYLVSRLASYFKDILENVEMRNKMGFSSTRKAHETKMLKTW